MPEQNPIPARMWLISPNSDPSKETDAVLVAKLGPFLETLSFDAAIHLLGNGATPDVILLSGTPSKAVQRLLVELQDRSPGVPVFLISHWKDADEMGKWMSQSVLEAIQPAGGGATSGAANPYQLSNREIEVLRLMTRGLIKKEIGEQLSISYHTIVHHERSIFEKLHVHTRSAAVAKALMEKLC